MSTEVTAFHRNVAVLSALLAGRYEDWRVRLTADASAPLDFLRFVERHYLAWFVTGAVDRSGLADVLPEADLARLRQAAETRRAKVGRIVDELDCLWPAFVARRVDAVLLKGPYIDQRFFGGEGRRAFFDLDLLVRAEQVGTAESLLRELGYARTSGVLVFRRLTMRFTHAFDYARDDLSLDLHWCPAVHASYRIDVERLMHGGGVYRSRRHAIPAPADEDALFLHLLALFEDLDRGAARLRSFVDVWAMLAAIDATVDWDAFWERRRTERTARACREVLGLFFALFDVESRFPRAAHAVSAVTERVRRQPPEATAALVESRVGAFRNKLWALRRYECTVPTSVAWWSVSLPFRVAVYGWGSGRAKARRATAAGQRH